MKVHFEAFGCTLNKGESHRMAEKACEEGFGLAETPDKSDCIVISTCTVIETTERKMLKRISELAGLRKPIIVSGRLMVVGANRQKVMEMLQIRPNGSDPIERRQLDNNKKKSKK